VPLREEDKEWVRAILRENGERVSLS
jgi:hypothetical protein